jgi:hypothetical protein
VTAPDDSRREEMAVVAKLAAEDAAEAVEGAEATNMSES